MPATPKILIIGGGLGGLTLAQSLRSQGIDYELFERDEGHHSRPQGWAGVALKSIVPHLLQIMPKEAPPIESNSVSAGQPEPDSGELYDGLTKQPMAATLGQWAPGTFIRLNRAKFRKYLLTGLSVHWGRRFTHYEILEGGNVKAFFEDGSTVIGNILVGADGVRSPVRNTLYQPNPPALNPIPAGIIRGKVTVNREQLERQAKLARSFYGAVGTGFFLFVALRSYSEDLSEGHFYWSFYFHEANPTQCWVKSAPKEEMLSFVKQKIQGIHPDFKEIVELQKPEDMGKPFVIFDRVPEVCPDGPVTLLGDAAHPMTPFRGEGANNAMRDAIELGQKLGDAIKAGSSLPDALRAYERLMVPRATNSVLGSRQIALDWTSN